MWLVNSEVIGIKFSILLILMVKKGSLCGQWDRLLMVVTDPDMKWTSFVTLRNENKIWRSLIQTLILLCDTRLPNFTPSEYDMSSQLDLMSTPDKKNVKNLSLITTEEDSIPEVICVNCLEGVSNRGWKKNNTQFSDVRLNQAKTE